MDLLVDELEEASTHLARALKDIVNDSSYDEQTFAVQLGHVMAHLNRAWARRNFTRELTDTEWDEIVSISRICDRSPNSRSSGRAVNKVLVAVLRRAAQLWH